MKTGFNALVDSFRDDDKKVLSALIFTVVASFAISLVSIHFSPILNRDGMMYIRLAELIGQGDVDEAVALFDWPFFSGLLFFLEKISPVSILAVAYGVSLFFAAMVSVMLVLLMQRVSPEQNIWWAVLIALSFPVTNEYRPDVLRDWPAWSFMLMSVWAYLRYVDRPVWSSAVTFSFSLVLAALFRLESAIVIAPLFFLAIREPALGWRDRCRFFLLPALLALLAIIALLAQEVGPSERVIRYWSAVNPLAIYEGLQKSGEVLAEGVLPTFSEDYGTQIFATGLLVIIPLELMHYLFALLIPWFLTRRHRDQFFSERLRVYVWLTMTWLLVGVLFLLRSYYLSSRYLVPMMLFMLPVLYAGVCQLRCRTKNRWLWGGLVFLIVLHGASAAIATRAMEKLSVKQAGRWVSENLPRNESVYINDGQVSFYAGRPYFRGSSDKIKPAEEVESQWQVRIVRRRDSEPLTEALKGAYRLIKVFDTGGDEVVMVFKHTD